MVIKQKHKAFRQLWNFTVNEDIIYEKFKLSDLLELQFREFNSTAKNYLSF